MHDCEGAYAELAVEANGTRNLTTMTTLAAYAMAECDAAQEAVIDLGRLTEGSIDAKQAVSTWLYQERQVALYHRNFASGAMNYVEIIKDPSFTSANKTRLLGEILIHFDEDAKKDHERKSLATTFFDKAKEALANDKGPPAKSIKLAPMKTRQVFDAFVSSIERMQARCTQPYDDLPSTLWGPLDVNALKVIGTRANVRCTEVTSQMQGTSAPSSLPKETKEWLAEWLSKAAYATSTSADAGQAIVWYAETGGKGLIGVFRNHRIAVVVGGREAEDALVEAQRSMGFKVP
jgi:hypothetical protein